MLDRFLLPIALLGLSTLLMSQLPTRADDTAKGTTPSAEQAHKAVQRGLAFLEKDVATWRKEHQCATCHHGTMTVWAYAEAKHQGYSVASETVADTVKWTKDRF
jgi:hypothetical protein